MSLLWSSVECFRKIYLEKKQEAGSVFRSWELFLALNWARANGRLWGIFLEYNVLWPESDVLYVFIKGLLSRCKQFD